ncbi:MAG TPA: hypothetical protein VML75_03830 [Kofleriaceae bacterium]|nr:hypothetical protein [Kofleriaceae bacterium]
MTAFVPCPACSGPVHAIASRCKHCKADLLAWREQAAQAARAARMGAPVPGQGPGQGPGQVAPAKNAAAMRQTNKSFPAPVAARRDHTPTRGDAPAAQPERTPAPAGTRAPRPLTPAPVVVYAQPTAWARRWPIAVSAVAIAAIVVSLVLLLRDGDDEAQPERIRSGSQSPRNIPDHMPEPKMGTPGQPQGRFDPQPFPAPGAPAPRSWNAAPDAGMFAVALIETVCAKLQDCGIRDDFSGLACRNLAKGAADADLDRKVQSGECHYDKVAADACFSAIGRFSCDASGSDVSLLLSQAMSLLDCSTAFVCR